MMPSQSYIRMNDRVKQSHAYNSNNKKKKIKKKMEIRWIESKSQSFI